MSRAEINISSSSVRHRPPPTNKDFSKFVSIRIRKPRVLPALRLALFSHNPLRILENLNRGNSLFQWRMMLLLGTELSRCLVLTSTVSGSSSSATYQSLLLRSTQSSPSDRDDFVCTLFDLPRCAVTDLAEYHASMQENVIAERRQRFSPQQTFVPDHFKLKRLEPYVFFRLPFLESP